MADEAANREAFRIQAFYCSRMDAPIYARLCEVIADALTPDTRTGARILGWAGEPTRDALPLRFVGGLHALVQAGSDSGLAAVFRGEITDREAIATALRSALHAHDDALLPWLDGPPQTNEPGRSAALMLGLMEIARRHGPRLEILEIGSSAGLNLLIDRYRFDLGGVTVGPDDAPVTIAPEWRGVAPEPVPVEIVSIRGCDVQPLDATDPTVGARLAAYVWAETPERAERLRGAIAMQRDRGVMLERADAAAWLAERLAVPQDAGVTRVLMHSVVWQYLPDETAQAIREMMNEVGNRATPERPLGWVMMEPDRALAQQVIRVKSWPGHAATAVIGTAHAHGTWVRGGLAHDPGGDYPIPASAHVVTG
ncbi:conserved hypothetical protein [Sphingomonas sp. EC-HK361]|uniref:DUF2332 domain-containing protein n=1 Tax=Sphingomonas sp. EC-HK361 TaxID=2038397 RepID=UPI001257C9F0|nr:DUF2332 family protein [Sphingomonas sp. EC-HK361]VVT07834.1 conserved hypothetical protein [Sphingomonas sp. EC-HK361]